jgi:hypothetical protein
LEQAFDAGKNQMPSWQLMGCICLVDCWWLGFGDVLKEFGSHPLRLELRLGRLVIWKDVFVEK